MSMRSFALLLLLTLTASAAGAATRFAANDGVDTATCGSKAAPCRSISRAIAHASPGDTVLVGPGYYGNLDGDEVLGEDGEEGQVASCSCAVHVDRRISLLSRDGAAATVIDGVEASVIIVDAPGSEIGRRNAGFTIRTTNFLGVGVQRGATGVKLAGNLLTKAPGAFALSLAVVDSDASRVADNRILSPDGGLALSGTASVGQRNSVFGGTTEINGSAVLTNHVNVGRGVLAFGEASVTRSLLAGNLGAGILSTDATTIRADRNNLYGNGTGDVIGIPGDPGPFNCGVRALAAATIESTHSFWGTFLGPGIDPGDEACAHDGGTVVTDPPARKEIRVRLRPIR
jgi:hypothetical protein